MAELYGVGNDGTVFRTLDGETFTTVGTIPDSNGGSQIISFKNKLYVIDSYQAHIYASADGGANWTLVYTTADSSLTGQFALFNNRLYLNVNSRVSWFAEVLETADGVNWNTVHSFSEADNYTEWDSSIYVEGGAMYGIIGYVRYPPDPDYETEMYVSSTDGTNWTAVYYIGLGAEDQPWWRVGLTRLGSTWIGGDGSSGNGSTVTGSSLSSWTWHYGVVPGIEYPWPVRVYNYVYATGYATALMRSSDGVNWASVLSIDGLTKLYKDLLGYQGNVYEWGDGGIYRSTDGGASFANVYAGDCADMCVAAIPRVYWSMA